MVLMDRGFVGPVNGIMYVTANNMPDRKLKETTFEVSIEINLDF